MTEDTGKSKSYSFFNTGSIIDLPDWYKEGEEMPKGERSTFTTWEHYKKDDPLLGSGLLGPVRIFAH